MEHTVKMLSEVCTMEHKQNKKKNMRNTHTCDIQDIQTEDSPHTDMENIQQHRKYAQRYTSSQNLSRK